MCRDVHFETRAESGPFTIGNSFISLQAGLAPTVSPYRFLIIGGACLISLPVGPRGLPCSHYGRVDV